MVAAVTNTTVLVEGRTAGEAAPEWPFLPGKALCGRSGAVAGLLLVVLTGSKVGRGVIVGWVGCSAACPPERVIVLTLPLSLQDFLLIDGLWLGPDHWLRLHVLAGHRLRHVRRGWLGGRRRWLRSSQPLLSLLGFFFLNLGGAVHTCCLRISPYCCFSSRLSIGVTINSIASVAFKNQSALPVLLFSALQTPSASV